MELSATQTAASALRLGGLRFATALTQHGRARVNAPVACEL